MPLAVCIRDGAKLAHVSCIVGEQMLVVASIDCRRYILMLYSVAHEDLHRKWSNMETIEIPLRIGHDPAIFPALIERAVADAGLLSSRLELRSYPGATHWHIKRPAAKGTLELTYWPQQSRLWFAVHANRRTDWIVPAIEALTARIQDWLFTSH